MMKWIGLGLMLGLMVACGSKKTPAQLANERLQKAKQMLANEQFTEAKLQIDSIRMLYPNEVKVLNQGVLLLNTVELTEQKRSFKYLDSLLQLREKQLIDLKKDFVLKPGGVQKNSGLYVHKRQQVVNSYNRTFVKAYLGEDGTFYISSKYVGKGYIHHNSIRVYDQGVFAETEEIPQDGVDNRIFQDDGQYWETVNYRNGKDNGVVSFIVNNFDKQLKLMFNGKKAHYIVLEKFDKEAIRDSYFLSKLMIETKELRVEVDNTKKRIAVLENEMDQIRSFLNQ